MDRPIKLWPRFSLSAKWQLLPEIFVVSVFLGREALVECTKDSWKARIKFILGCCNQAARSKWPSGKQRVSSRGFDAEPNRSPLVNLIGYCADGDQRLLVYEYMPLGSLDDHLNDPVPGRKQLDWNTRMRVAAGAAKGLEYLHNKASPPVIYRDLKCSNILLGEGYHPKLSDFGLAKLRLVGDNTHVSTRVMGTYGYCAPEYAMTGQLTLK